MSYSRNFPYFMEPEGLSPYSQEPIICPYLEPDNPSHVSMPLFEDPF
jgi:hypothetical protein